MLAQTEVGGATINGTVLDPSGAAVPNARLTAANPDNDRAPMVGRNTVEVPGIATWDLRLTRDIGVWERARLRLIFEAFDLTNRANFNVLQQNKYTFRNGMFTPTTNYLTPQTMLDPGTGSRVLQLAAKLTF